MLTVRRIKRWRDRNFTSWRSQHRRRRMWGRQTCFYGRDGNEAENRKSNFPADQLFFFRFMLLYCRSLVQNLLETMKDRLFSNKSPVAMVEMQFSAIHAARHPCTTELWTGDLILHDARSRSASRGQKSNRPINEEMESLSRTIVVFGRAH